MSSISLKYKLKYNFKINTNKYDGIMKEKLEIKLMNNIKN